MATCYKCFSEYEGSGSCPECGFDVTGQEDRYPHALRPGTIVGGRYIVGRVLGQGGFGITYAAQDYDTKGLVAIKEFMPETLATRINHTTVKVYSAQYETDFNYGKENFLNEAKTLSQFNGQSNICDIYTYFEENGTAYFAMEYVNGIGLDDYLKQHGGPLSFEEARKLLMPLMRALSNVHAKGIIHRDISPDNIMVQPDGNVMLIDFGAARYSMGEKSQSLDVILKHGFAPKEQYARHGRQGPYTDVYAMASTFYYAVTGKVLMDAVERKESDIIPMPGLSKSQYKALEKALAIEPAKRWQTMKDFISAVEKARAEPVKKPKEEKARAKTEKPGKTEKSEPAETKPTAVAGVLKKLEKKHIIAAALLLIPILIFAAAGGGDKEPEPTPTPTPEPTATVPPVTVVKSGKLGELSWKLDSEGLLIISGSGEMAFDGERPWNVSKIVSVEISEGITNVPEQAFADAVNLERVILPESLEIIDRSAFSGCENLSELVIPNNVNTIENSAFKGCKRLDVNLPENLKVLGAYAFLDCESLSKVHIPAGIDLIYERTFENCISLSEITMEASGEIIAVVHNGAFKGCISLSKVELGRVESVREDVFSGCTSLKEVAFSTAINRIDMNAFSGCPINVVYYPGDKNMWSVITGKGAVSIKGKLVVDGEYSWDYAEGTKTLSIEGTGPIENFASPEEVPWAKYAGEAENLVIGEGITAVGANAFSEFTALKNVSFSEGLYSIGEYAFFGCTGLKELKLVESIDYVGEYAFAYCSGLEGNLQLPYELGYIKDSAFKACSGVTSVHLPYVKKEYAENIFDGCRINTVYVEAWNVDAIFDFCDSCTDLKNATRLIWGDLTDTAYFLLDSRGTLTVYGSGDMGDFEKYSSLEELYLYFEDRDAEIKSVVISDGITSVGKYTFKELLSLESLTLPRSIVSIGEEAFYGCENLSYITFSAGLKEIGAFAFSQCVSLSSLSLPEGIETIGNGAFESCESLSSISLPKGIQNMGQYIFEFCTNLRSISLPEDMAVIPDTMFASCESLSSVSLPEGVKTISECAFEECRNLSSITIPESIEVIEENAFRGCEALSTVYYKGSMMQWDRFGFEGEALKAANIICSK